MKFKDQVKWTDQEIELQADESSRQFLAFFIKWFETAEHCVEENSGVDVIEAVRLSLFTVETETEFLSMEWIGQMLLVATQHWHYGDKLLDGLSTMEHRMLTQMAAIKLADLQANAVESS